MVGSMCNSEFTDKSDDESWAFLHEVAEKTQQWETIREPRKTVNRTGIHRIESDFEINAKMASVIRRLHSLELQKGDKPNVSVSCNQVEMSMCFFCNSSEHLDENCPKLHEIKESILEQDNALYQKHENNPYSRTYNPGWRNHPNFSWSKGPVQGGTSGNNQGYSYPRNPQLKDQRLASLELKLGQICDALNEREKGNLPSQPRQNPKSAFQASTSACNKPPHNQVNTVTTLRSGRVVENNVGIPRTSKSESDSPLHNTPQKTHIVENESEHVDKSKSSADVNISLPCKMPVAPFPQRQIPAYAKFLKDVCTEKQKLHVHKRAFLTEQLGLGEMKPTPVTLQLADRSVKIPRGIVEDVLIKVNKFYFPVDFIVSDTQHVQNPDNHIPVILGRPFLATSNAIINCGNGVMKLYFGNMTMELNVFNVSQ
ncbi:uncharacterized protein LOC113272863 [Papaver somniferum]|uniref:uncharacterized protein LOC113272863 n=1 Tax=Papaver somniferum TaxID=3469 RepID=UPI000E705728|nr:uncharacterized protein LOC113272863 [Papaver somniferum]